MPLQSTIHRPTPRMPTLAPSWSEDPLTARTRSIWSGADFHPIARSFAPGAEAFVDRLALRSEETVLDVACGTGNLAIPAAKRGAAVCGIDIAPNLIATARAEAASAGVSVDFEVGDAEALPYADHRFATVISMFGAMFAPRPERAAAELVRVTRRGGRIVMANWTPEGFVGSLLRAHAAVVPPPAGVPSPLLWGNEEVVRTRFAGAFTALVCTRKHLEFHFPFAPSSVTELFATYYGPTVSTLKAAGTVDRLRLRESLTTLWREANIASDGTTVVRAEYLEVTVDVA